MIVGERASTKRAWGGVAGGEGVMEPEEGKLADGGAEDWSGGHYVNVLYGGDG